MTTRELRDVERIVLSACGTALHACRVGECLIENLAHIPTEVEFASEFRYRNIPMTKDTLVFTVSQSGETIDTLAALRESKRKGYRTLGICNSVGSTIARESDGGVHGYNRLRLSMPLKFCHEKIRTLIRDDFLKICEIGESAVSISDKRDFFRSATFKTRAGCACLQRKTFGRVDKQRGQSLDGIFFRWNKGPSASRIHARAHRPENCFPGAGYKLPVDRGNFNVQIQNLSIRFHALDFEREGERLHVFFCLSEDGLKPTERPRIQDEWNPVARLQSVLIGKRNLGQRVLEIVVSRYGTPEAAEAALRREIPGMIQTHA
jgi:D-arabinose 5-phosphate isomerase GutQ